MPIKALLIAIVILIAFPLFKLAFQKEKDTEEIRETLEEKVETSSQVQKALDQYDALKEKESEVMSLIKTPMDKAKAIEDLGHQQVEQINKTLEE